MIANAPYIDLINNNFIYSPIVNEYTVDFTDDNKNNDNTLSFLNVYEDLYQITPTEEVVNREQKLSKRICDIMRIQYFIQKYPSIFACSSEQFVLSTIEQIHNGLTQLSFDLLSSNIAEEEECFFIYGQKKDIKIFFNLFFEKNDVETLVNISTQSNKYVIEDNVENSIQRLYEICQKKNYGNLP